MPPGRCRCGVTRDPRRCRAGGILCAKAHMLPCHRTGAWCRAGGPPTPTAAGRCAVGAAQVAASAGAAHDVPRWAGVTGCAKYQFSEGGRLRWPPEKLAPQCAEGPISLQLVFSERSDSRNTLHARPRRGASARARARRRTGRGSLSGARAGRCALPVRHALKQAPSGPEQAAYRRRGVPPAPQHSPALGSIGSHNKSPVRVLHSARARAVGLHQIWL